MSMIAPRMVLALAQVFDDSFFRGFNVVSVKSSGFVSGNVICLKPGEVIAHSENRAAIEALLDAGVKLHTLNLSEFIKGAGGPTCLILPVERKNLPGNE